MSHTPDDHPVLRGPGHSCHLTRAVLHAGGRPSDWLRILLPLIGTLATSGSGWCAQAGPQTEVAGLDSIRLAGRTSVLVQGHVPTDHYAVFERSSGWGATFRPEAVVVPTDPTNVRTALPLTPGATAGFIRLRAIPLEAPEDLDGDGIDDLYEAYRSHVLDPLDGADARRDADGDGDSNLTEYLSRTEAAPPRSDAPVRYASLAELRRTAPVPLPPLLYLGGHDAEGDGWGGWFAWREDDRRQPDTALIVAFRFAVPGRLERVVEAGDPIRTAWWRPPAVPDGDAGPALQQAFQYLSTRPVRRLVISPGRFRVSTQRAWSEPTLVPLHLVGVEDFEIDGAGATLWTTDDGEILMLKDCHRGILRNLAFEGAGSDRSLTNFNYAVVGLVGEQSDLEFNRCNLKGFMHGISHLHGEKTSVRVTIRECRFEDGGDLGHQTLGTDGAAISGIGDDWLVENCFFHECGRSIEVENTDKVDPIRRVVIRGNRLTNVRNVGIMAFLGGPYAHPLQQSDIVVRDNFMVGKSPRHIDPRGDRVPILHLSINGGSRWIVQGNICEEGDYAGISLYANQAEIRDSVVTGNIVTRMGGRGIQIYSTPEVPLSGVLVSNNRIRDCYDRGLLLVGQHIVASGNLIENTAIGIAVGDPDAPLVKVEDVVVRGNFLRSIAANLPAIYVGATARGTAVVDNDVTAAAVGIRDLSGVARIEGNRFLGVLLDLDSPVATP